MQEKAGGDVNKLRQCTGLKAKLNQDLSSGSQFPSNHLNKVYTFSSKVCLCKVLSTVLGKFLLKF